jgi:hypothetical protein
MHYTIFYQLSKHGWFPKFIKFYYCDVLILLVTHAFSLGQIFTMCAKKNWGKLELFWKSVNSRKLLIFCQTFETTKLKKIKIKIPGSDGRKNLCTSSTFYIWKQAPTPTPIQWKPRIFHLHFCMRELLTPLWLQCQPIT